MIKKRVISIFVFLFLFNFISFSSAEYCATTEITSISPSSIGSDEDFTVGIQIDNCGDELPENIIFEITRHSEDIEVKESLINFIGTMGYANSKRFILYHMHSTPNASPGEHIFETKLTYGGENFLEEIENNFSIIVNTQEPDLTISRIYTNPEIIYNGEKVILIIDVENAGNGEAKDVRVEIENLNLVGIKQKYLGKIQSDENLPARFVLEASKKGIFEGNIKLNYKFGGEIKELNFPLQIQIFSKGISKYWTTIIILILGVLGYFLFEKKLILKNRE